MKLQPVSVYHLRITLENTQPIIWRDVLVPSHINLNDLHDVIQVVMGWSNCHLHQFIANQLLYSDYAENLNHYNRNENLYTLSQLLVESNQHILYEYDFNDSWLHKIELKAILPADDQPRNPRCIKGRRACPPEDCGGVWGYTDILETLERVEHHDEVFPWLDKRFNPEHFDIEAVNKQLEKFASISLLENTA